MGDQSTSSGRTGKLVTIGACAGAALALGGAIAYYYATKEEDGSKKRKKKMTMLDIENVSVGEVNALLSKVVQSQEDMKAVMKKLCKDIREKDLAFPEVYELVKKINPSDPLEESGMQMEQFDKLLEKFKDDPGVREKIVAIMGSSFQNEAPVKPNLDVKKVVEVHGYMLQVLKDLAAQIKTESLDPRTSTITVQAIVGAGVERNFHITSEDVESAVFKHRQELSGDTHFSTINLEMRKAMEMIVGDAPARR